MLPYVWEGLWESSDFCTRVLYEISGRSELKIRTGNNVYFVESPELRKLIEDFNTSGQCCKVLLEEDVKSLIRKLTLVSF